MALQLSAALQPESIVQAHCGGGAPARRKGGVKKKSMIIYNVSHDGVYTIRGERDVASSPLGRALSILPSFSMFVV